VNTRAALLLAALWATPANATPERPAPPQVRIDLRPEVEVRARLVSLGDVAYVSTPDLATLERLLSVPLGPAPRPGVSTRLERSALVRWVHARTGLGTARIVWAGAPASVVRGAARRVSGRELATTAEEALRAAIAAQGARGELTPTAIPEDLTVPGGEVRLTARGVPRAALSSARVAVWVELRVDGRLVRAVPIRFDLRVTGPGYVAAAPQRSGQPLDQGALEVREVPWTGGEVVPVTAGAGGLRLRRTLRPGEALTRGHVEPLPAVGRGAWAALLAGQGAVRLETRVEVLEDGGTGSLVRVRRPGSQATFVARVTGPGQLEVEP